MSKLYPLKIDIFSHIMPPKYKDALFKILPADSYWRKNVESRPTLFDIERRLGIMDRFDGMVQVLTSSAPAVELLAEPKKAVELAKMANDEMAELVSRYPDRFIAAVAAVPINDVDASLKEIERAINDLEFRGVQINTPVNEKPLDSAEFIPIFELMSKYNFPIWLHPHRPGSYPDYRAESSSKYRIFHMFGWPYETTAAMSRIVFSGILERYPNLKIITHHCGGMIPFFESRILQQQYYRVMQSPDALERLTRPPVDYFKMFYADTALRTVPALTCGYQFFGADHVLFGTDMPFDCRIGDYSIRGTVNAIEQMDITDVDRKKIYEDNARSMLRLTI